ncbi:hypothetical protein [Gluconobacter albidus]|uniref:Uncharacterized protein n=1 Tax=Gluconobacter albidus TaxID=318683 RepID=A0AAW3QVD1_9PROT|nr:hypothetical protein [Gluconobacter albidus]KXV36944.1 hypothetical protein AD941_12775 [Gluconobacter albidus]MBS1027005.1 hypothetical protein [Gluconobacter albidus]MCP1274297.1 hypothetical protein [Gluconobacter albidus]GBQ82609.1 hypothetical protein AA3250_0056 [Gluconobacter albidus NBRC 3250]GLQ69785.1 hypothetical protein GCM10007866_22380 [Gluconobacter albidus]
MSDASSRRELFRPYVKLAVAADVGYGANNEGYVRIAEVKNEQSARQEAHDIKRYLKSMGVNVPSGNEV